MVEDVVLGGGRQDGGGGGRYAGRWRSAVGGRWWKWAVGRLGRRAPGRRWLPLPRGPRPRSPGRPARRVPAVKTVAGRLGSLGAPPPWWEERRRREDATPTAVRTATPAGCFGRPRRGERGNSRGQHQQQKLKGKKQAGGASGDGLPPAKDKAKHAAPAAGECFKCGREGHFQSECTFDPLCVVCSGEGHTSANCPSRGKGMRLETMGHAITGGGFYNIDVEPLKGGKGSGEVFAAVIKFAAAPLSEEQLSDELKHLVDELWDWQVRKISDSEFSVVFPTRQTLKLSTGSGKLHLPLSKTDTEIREAFLAPRPSLILPSTWVRLTGVPEDLMVRERLMAAFTMIGRPIDVDELSIKKSEHEPIRMRFHCRYPERIKGSVQIFVNGEGYTVGVQAEAPPRGSAGAGTGGPPPPPARKDREDDSDELSSDSEWNKHRRSRRGGKEKGKGDDPPSAAGGASGPSGSKSVGASLGVALVLDQYGSNLSASAEVLPSLPLLDASKLMPGVQSDHLGAFEESLESGEMESHLTDPLASWVEDSQQAEGPPAKVARRSLPSPPPAVGAEGVELVEMETVEESDVEEQVEGGDLRAEVAVVTPIAQGPRSKAVYYKRAQATPASAVRKSARNASVAPGTSALARAQQLIAEKNLEGKTAPASTIGKEKDLEGSGQTEGLTATGRGTGRG
nr:uncharacterized protein LOC127347246 [Lolium perenne]